MGDKIIPFDTRRTRKPARHDRPARSCPPVPRVPDFARADATWLQPCDITFLLGVGRRKSRPYVDDDADGELIVDGVPAALETLVERESVYEQVVGETGGWLDISPQLYFHVVLRRQLPTPRTYLQRRVIRYLANLLSLFVRTDRLYRIQPDEHETFEYLVDLIAEAAESDHERQFLVHAHLGNYALYIAGLGRDWIEYRRRYGRSALGVDYYYNMGRRAFKQAADHRLSRDLNLAPVFDLLCRQFVEYAGALQQVAMTPRPSSFQA